MPGVTAASVSTGMPIRRARRFRPPVLRNRRPVRPSMRRPGQSVRGVNMVTTALSTRRSAFPIRLGAAPSPSTDRAGGRARWRSSTRPSPRRYLARCRTAWAERVRDGNQSRLRRVRAATGSQPVEWQIVGVHGRRRRTPGPGRPHLPRSRPALLRRTPWPNAPPWSVRTYAGGAAPRACEQPTWLERLIQTLDPNRADGQRAERSSRSLSQPPCGRSLPHRALRRLRRGRPAHCWRSWASTASCPSPSWRSARTRSALRMALGAPRARRASRSCLREGMTTALRRRRSGSPAPGCIGRVLEGAVDGVEHGRTRRLRGRRGDAARRRLSSPASCPHAARPRWTRLSRCARIRLGPVKNSILGGSQRPPHPSAEAEATRKL